jgi:hypothetical protein
MKKRLKINFHFVSFYHLSLGFHVDLSIPNIEFHVPFGFLRIGITYSPDKKIFEFSSAKEMEKLLITELRERGYEVMDKKYN